MQNMLNSNKIFVKEEVTNKNKKKTYMCAFKNNQFTQLCIFGYKVG